MAPKDLATLRDDAAGFVARGRLDKAVEAYAELEAREPTSPQWSKRLAESYRKLGRNEEAIAAFERAADRFVQDGFLVQAIAMCKLILQIDAARTATTQRLVALTTSQLPKVRGRPKAPTLPPPGAPLDIIELSTLVPRARKLHKPDGSLSGITLLPIDDEVIQIELDDIQSAPPASIEDAIAVADLEWPAEVEVVEAPATPTRIELTQGARLALRDTPLFARLTQRELERLIGRMAFQQLEPDDLVFAEGDPGRTLYVVTDGEVVVEAKNRELARLGAGAFFGEIALVTELPRSATVRAATRVDLLAIDRDVVREAIAEQPRVVDVLLAFVRTRLVDGVTRTSELFRPFTAVDRAALSARFELLEVAVGATLVEHGARADGLYVMLAGRCEVTRDGRTLAALGSGDVFGEMSLLSGTGAIAAVVAASRVLALRMPAATFREVMMTHPQLLAHLSELADARALEFEAALAAADGDDDAAIEILDLHLDLV